MNLSADDHTPTSHFREQLERDLTHAFRSESTESRAVAEGKGRFRMAFAFAAAAVVLLSIGMVLGSSVSYASAEVVDAQRREANSSILNTTRQFVSVELEQARINRDRARVAVEKNAAAPTTLDAAEAQVSALHAIIERIDGELSASRANASPPSALIKGALSVLGCAPSTGEQQSRQATTSSQQAVPIVDLTTPGARSTQTLGGVLGVQEANDGRLVVNDAKRRQIHLFDRDLAKSTVVFDSVPGSARSYGMNAGPLFPFKSDSSLFRDGGVASGMLVLDGSGQPARALALVPEPVGTPALAGQTIGLYLGPTFVDAEGRLLYKANRNVMKVVPVPLSGLIARPTPPDGKMGGFTGRTGGAGTDGPPSLLIPINDRSDSLPIFRMDLESRRIDTVAFVMQPPEGASRTGGGKTVLILGSNGAVQSVKQVINPLYMIDEWTVLSDGTIAIVRGSDYHVDWIHPDGTRSSTPKLPFEWRRLTDDDKQRLVDSTRRAIDTADSAAIANFGRAQLGRATPAPPVRLYRYEIVSPSKIADYYPPMRLGAVLPDRDGNLWILPRSTTLSKNGELVYDVVNPVHGLVKRVRLPAGRSIAGFGKRGVVYLQAGDVTNGFILERSLVPR